MLKFGMVRTVKADFRLLQNSGRQILSFEIIYKLAATAIIFPLTMLFIQFVLQMAGISYLTNEYIGKALTNPFILLFIVLLIFLFVSYCTYEMAFLATCFELKRQEYPLSNVETILTAFMRFKRFLRVRNVPIALFYFLMIVAVNITVCGNILYSQPVLAFISTFIIKGTLLIKIAVAFGFLVAYVLILPGIYTFNIFILEEQDFLTCYKRSCRIMRKHPVKVILSLVAYNLAILVVIGFFYVLLSVLLIAGVRLLNMAYLGSAVLLSVLKYMRRAIKLLLLSIAIPISYTVISRMYYRDCDEENIDFKVIRVNDRDFQIQRKIYRFILIVSVLLNGVSYLFTFHDNPFEKVAIFHETKITAHRGASKEAPENSLSAFRIAMEQMSDFIELDVQLTSDGEVVVFHDETAKRVAGVDRRINSMTLEEIKQLDIGSSFDEAYAGEQVPTLREVLELTDGKIMLNIEIKSAAATKVLTEKVMKLVQEYNVIEKCVITSFDYNALQYAKKCDNRIQVGYILSVAYGDFYDMKGVDFFSVNASFLSKRTVDAIHNSGKQAYAWTVNEKTSIKNLSNKGVDNIITDAPVLARETVYSRDTSETLVNMLKYVFNQ